MGATERTLSWDWYPGIIPENVICDEAAYIETTFSFQLYRSQEPVGMRIGRGASIYLGTMFDVGRCGRLSIGEYTLINGARVICDSEIEIGAYTLISWNVVLMDTYRAPVDPSQRRLELERAPFKSPRRIDAGSQARPIRIGRNVWIGFDACVLAGVTIGEGAIVGTRSVVTEDVEPFSVVGGNPARLIRKLESREISDES